ncbi:MAG: GNAT family N-acetyltransferase [Candidatus Wallbacteria bacterium]|nr:GNAT family N-acetyltransferase [Candidatus Wallbacteria bacterium]
MSPSCGVSDFERRLAAARRTECDAHSALSLRPIADSDLPFLRELYASTRVNELAPVPWSSDQKVAFLNQQFDCQHRAYTQGYPGASLDLIFEDGEPVGRFYVHRRPGDLRIIDIALIPGARNRGIGAHCLRALLEEARALGVTVSIHVEHSNPAVRLYRRLGFQSVDASGVYVQMEWRPDADSDSSSSTGLGEQSARPR